MTTKLIFMLLLFLLIVTYLSLDLLRLLNWAHSCPFGEVCAIGVVKGYYDTLWRKFTFVTCLLLSGTLGFFVAYKKEFNIGCMLTTVMILVIINYLIFFSNLKMLLKLPIIDAA